MAIEWTTSAEALGEALSVYLLADVIPTTASVLRAPTVLGSIITRAAAGTASEQLLLRETNLDAKAAWIGCCLRNFLRPRGRAIMV